MHRRIYRRKLLWPEIFLKRCMDWDIAELKKTAISKSMHRRIYRRKLLWPEILLKRCMDWDIAELKIGGDYYVYVGKGNFGSSTVVEHCSPCWSIFLRREEPEAL